MKVYKYSTRTMIIYGLFSLFSLLVSITFLVLANGVLFYNIIGILGLAGSLVGEIITISFNYRISNDLIIMASLFQKTTITFDNIDHIKYFESKKNNGIFVVGRDNRIIITNKTENYKEMINEIIQKIVHEKLHVNIDPDVYLLINSLK